MDDLQNAGVVVIAIVLILREVAAIVKARRDPDAKADASAKYDALFKIVRTTAGKVDALYDCHLGPQALDSDGAPKWYVRAALPEAVSEVGKALTTLNDTLREMHHDHQEIKKQLARVEKKVGA